MAKKRKSYSRTFSKKKWRKPAGKRYPKYIWLYVLECADNHYYVGQTTNVERRFKEHLKGKRDASWFTKVHKPIRVLYTREICICSAQQGLDMESELTIEWMQKYSMETVRGGALIQRDKMYWMDVYNRLVPSK